MTPQTTEEWLDSLERRVTRLERLPVRVDALTLQVSQFRAEVRAEFSAVRGEIKELGEGLRGEIKELREELRGEIKELRDELRGEIGQLRGDLWRQTERIDALGTNMRVLHEEVLARIAVMGEGKRKTAVRRRKKGR